MEVLRQEQERVKFQEVAHIISKAQSDQLS